MARSIVTNALVFSGEATGTDLAEVTEAVRAASATASGTCDTWPAHAAQMEAEAVARAICSAAQRSAGRGGTGAGAPGALVAAGKACAAALRTLLDVLCADGATAVARAARTFHAETGLAAGAATRGGFAARALLGRATDSPALAAVSGGARSPEGRTTAQLTTLSTIVDDSPRARMIRQLEAKKAAEAAAARAADTGGEVD
eukprot:943176-Pleurochrysis_carterae.AAC.4